MPDEEATSTMMLEGLFDSANERAWSEFDRRYRPLMIGFARRHGLAEQDAVRRIELAVERGV